MKQEKPPNEVDQYTRGGKTNLQKFHSQADLKANLMEQCDEDVV
jgi:hypothetical protein